MAPESCPRAVEHRARDEQRAERGARGGREHRASQERAPDGGDGARSHGAREPDDPVDESRCGEDPAEGAGKEPGEEHRHDDRLRDRLDHRLGPGVAIGGERAAQREGEEEDRPEAPLVRGAGEGERANPGDEDEHRRERAEGPEAEGQRVGGHDAEDTAPRVGAC